MRNLILMVLMLIGISAFAQEKRVLSYDNPRIQIENKEYILEYVDDWGHATVLFKRYDINGRIVEQGKYQDGKPDGKWFSYDENGEVLAEAVYYKGKRVKLTSHARDDGKTYTIIYKDRYAMFNNASNNNSIAQVIITGF